MVLGHFSDIHMNYFTVDTAVLRKRLLTFLSERNIKLDALIISGDIYYKGEPSKDICSYINKLCNATSCPVKSIFLCCGNHDILRTGFRTGTIKYQLEQTHKSGKYTIEEDVYRSLFSIGHKQFIEAYQIITGRAHPPEPHFVIETDTYNLIIINTCLLSGIDNEQLYTTDYVLAGLLEKMPINCDKPCIAIGHHGVQNLADADQDNFLMLLDDLGVDLYLCGHSHRLGCETFELTRNKIRQSTVGGLISDCYTNISFSTITLNGVQCSLQYYCYVNGMWQEQPGGHMDFFPPRLISASKTIHSPNEGNFSLLTPAENSMPSDMTDTRAPKLEDIPNIFLLSDMRLPYLPIISSCNWGENEYRYGDIHVELEPNSHYKIPDAFKMHWDMLGKAERGVIEAQINSPEDKVRINNFLPDIRPGFNRLTLFFSPITYTEFLMTSNHLDYPITPGGDRTFRDKYFSDTSSFIKPQLSCICGVGVFLISSDNKIIVRQSSDNVMVAASMYSYSASGTMDWNESLHPFEEIYRECKEEIAYPLNMNDLFMYSFGMDYTQAYFQFSFYERSPLKASQIISKAPLADDFCKEIKKLVALDFSVEAVVDCVRDNTWDPTAAATLLTLLTKEFSRKAVETYINPMLQEEEYRTSMIDKWDRRAKRKGSMAVFSNRIPLSEIDRIAKKFLDEVLAFIGDDLPGRSVLEAGCGIGLMTKRLAETARSVCCVDLSEQMIKRSKEYLGTALLSKVEYHHCFMQDFQGDGLYDLLVSAQMLIHNLEDYALKAITEKMKAVSNTIFLFEQLDNGNMTSSHTKPLSFKEYISYFPEYRVAKEDIGQYLFTDNYAFVKLVRN